MSRIAALTTCVSYSDFLSHFLLFNKNVFDRLLVVTTEEDKDTQAVCKYYHVECLITDAFYQNGQVFGKSQAINVGIRHLLNTGENDYLCHLDSDIVLPPRTGDFIRAELNDKSCIYTIDRMRVVGFENWVNFIAKPELIYEEEVWLRCDRFPMMPRIFKDKKIVPIGYFQLWHSDYAKDVYPETHENAARSDMLFALKWAAEKRKLIPMAVGFHLESEPSKLGTNWNGRKTKRFGLDKELKKDCVEVVNSNNVNILEKVWSSLEYFLSPYRT